MDTFLDPSQSVDEEGALFPEERRGDKVFALFISEKCPTSSLFFHLLEFLVSPI